jgi:glycine/D-amino acid oxidase-like deaminating enzyme
MSDYTATLSPVRWADEPRPAYDVVIIGGGGHGLSTAYHLATRHGITNVAVLEADYIASGNTGRNTTIIRANYGIPEAIRFYQHSLERYQHLEEETGAAILHQTKGIVWLAHTEMAMRTERARAAMNQACGAQTFMRTPQELKELVPQLDLTGGGRYPVLGGSHHVEGATARHDLHAFVTNDYAPGFPIILASTELACYVSQTERGQMLIGAEFDTQPSYSRQSSYAALRSYAYKITRLLPFLQQMRILRQWAGICDISVDFSPIMSGTDVRGFYVTTGWGTWGFKAIPAGGEGMAELIATGTAPALIAPFTLDRFARDHVLADAGSAGTR